MKKKTRVRKYFREYRGNRSQETMGHIYGVSQQSWARWESGQSLPKASIMLQIADDIGISARRLIDDYI